MMIITQNFLNSASHENEFLSLRLCVSKSFYLIWVFKVSKSKGECPVIAEITRILTAKIRRQFFFVITTTASTRCQNFQLICYLQRVNATSQYNHSGSSRCSKWPNDRMVAAMKHCWHLVQGRRGCRERWLKATTGLVFKKILPCSVSHRVILIA